MRGITFLSSVLGFCVAWVCTHPVQVTTVSVSSNVCPTCCAQKTLFLGPSIASGSYSLIPCHFHSSMSLEERDLIKTWHLGPSILELFVPWSLSNAGFCVSFHVLQEETSLMRFGQHINLGPTRVSLFYFELLFSSWLLFFAFYSFCFKFTEWLLDPSQTL